MIELIKFNRRKLQSAQDAGSLIDFQIIGTREDSGYLD